jgi:hypothetical protein
VADLLSAQAVKNIDPISPGRGSSDEFEPKDEQLDPLDEDVIVAQPSRKKSGKGSVSQAVGDSTRITLPQQKMQKPKGKLRLLSKCFHSSLQYASLIHSKSGPSSRAKEVQGCDNRRPSERVETMWSDTH